MVRQSTDLLPDCVRSLEEQLKERVDPSSVTSQVCSYCRNPTCKRAGWADSQWQARMDTQVDYLLDNPQFSDLVLPRHLMVHKEEWADRRREAMKLDIVVVRHSAAVGGDIVGPVNRREGYNGCRWKRLRLRVVGTATATTGDCRRRLLGPRAWPCHSAGTSRT